MSHLVCLKHKKRVLVLSNSVIHRSSLDPCDTDKVRISMHEWTPEGLRASKLLIVGEPVTRELPDPGEELLKEIFTIPGPIDTSDLSADQVANLTNS
jgi:hypothetical protein